MNGVHDMGGMHGFGRVEAERDEPVFHSRWEATVRAVVDSTVFRHYHLDEFRHAIERMPPEHYLRAGYYEKWLHAVETLLLEKGVVTEAELNGVVKPTKVVRPARVREPAPPLTARFAPGARVRTLNINPRGHTRLPRYVRSKRGIVRTVNGPLLLPDSNAHGGHDWQACYAVEFAARELWGEEASAVDTVCVDLWESYLTPEEGE